jgi:hypothetical protein
MLHDKLPLQALWVVSQLVYCQDERVCDMSQWQVLGQLAAAQ